MINMKKVLSFLLASFLAAVMAVFPAGAVGATTKEVDVIFLVDASRSMLQSDPDLIRLEAIKLFSDLCSLGSTKIGFVLFGAEINYSQTPIPIETEEDRAALKKQAEGLTDLRGATDIGLGVKYAVDMLAADEYIGNGKFIVFLSDGKSVIAEGASERTMESSKSDLEESIIKARDVGIPIYTIGLNANGDVDEAELNHISTSTYADKTYITTSAGDLSRILSDIYIHHTGAETGSLDDYVSDGEYHDTSFIIPDSSVVEANIVIMHSAKSDDIQLFGAGGKQVLFDGKAAEISQNAGYTLVKVYYPSKGEWRLSVKSGKETKVGINYIFTRDYGLKISYMTDKPVGEGATVKFETKLTDPKGKQITDTAVLSALVPRVIVTDEKSGEPVSVQLKQDEKTLTYKGEYKLPAECGYTFQASFFNANIDIRSDIVSVKAGDKSHLEPEGPLKLILIIAGAVAVFVIVLIIVLKYLGNNIKMWSGRLMISVNANGMPEPPAAYDFAKKIPGKRKVMLSQVMKTLFEGKSAADALPESVAGATKISMTKRGEVRISKVKGPEYSGGIILGGNVILSASNKVTLKYKDSSGKTTMIVILYQRT